jgi:hypothetical protein
MDAGGLVVTRLVVTRLVVIGPVVTGPVGGVGAVVAG